LTRCANQRLSIFNRTRTGRQIDEMLIKVKWPESIYTKVLNCLFRVVEDFSSRGVCVYPIIYGTDNVKM